MRDATLDSPRRRIDRFAEWIRKLREARVATSSAVLPRAIRRSGMEQVMSFSDAILVHARDGAVDLINEQKAEPSRPAAQVLAARCEPAESHGTAVII